MIIGNGGGGKTTLARALAEALDLPLHHVDSIQFRPGWERTPVAECDRALDAIAAGPTWVLDGFGSRACIERRMRAADTVVLVDFPPWRHVVRALRRQWASRRAPRAELPPGCPEDTLAHTLWLLRVLLRVHRELRPWLRERAAELGPETRLVHLRSPAELAAFRAEVVRGAARPGHGARAH